MATFRDKLAAAVRANDSLLCVGLDTDVRRLPVKDPLAFNRAIIEATADLVCAYKPNLAFYEALGMPGLRLLEKTLRAIPSHIPVIGDAKRADIGNTSEMYARALFDGFGFDAATVNPYLGTDALQPFLDYKDKGIFILCRTSNPGAADFQGLTVQPGGVPLYEAVARKALEWDKHGNVGLVVGATAPAELRRVRALCPDMPLLLPGVGAQGGDIEQAVRSGVRPGGDGIIVNASRQVLYAGGGRGYASAARQAAQDLRDAINRHRGA